jgi:hypothetical protein
MYFPLTTIEKEDDEP